MWCDSATSLSASAGRFDPGIRALTSLTPLSLPRPSCQGFLARLTKRAAHDTRSDVYNVAPEARDTEAALDGARGSCCRAQGGCVPSDLHTLFTAASRRGKAQRERERETCVFLAVLSHAPSRSLAHRYHEAPALPASATDFAAMAFDGMRISVAQLPTLPSLWSAYCRQAQEQKAAARGGDAGTRA